MSTSDSGLERRILAVLPAAKDSWDRGQLLLRLGRCGGETAAATLAPIVDGATKASSYERSMALQGLAAAVGANGIESYRKALRDRPLALQTLALTLLGRYDEDGAAADDVANWLTNRLKGRLNRKTWDYRELPLAIAYFAKIHQLKTIATLLTAYDNQLLPVERRVLELMWPPEDRNRWATGESAPEPDFTGMDDHGHPHEYYLQIESEINGHAPITFPPPETQEQKDQFLRRLDSEFEKLLNKLERRTK